MSRTFSLKGLEGVREQLAAVDAELAAKALGQAMREAMKPVLATAKQLVPVWSGALRDALTLSVVKPSSGDLVIAVGLRVSSGGSGSKQAAIAAAAFGEGQSRELPPARRWHFIELGTIHLKAHPYARPALDQNAQGVLDSLKDLLAKKIQAAVQKKAKGGG